MDKEKLAMQIATELKILRKKRGLSQVELGQACEVSQRLISQIENGKLASGNKIGVLFSYFGVRIELSATFQKCETITECS